MKATSSTSLRGSVFLILLLVLAVAPKSAAAYNCGRRPWQTISVNLSVNTAGALSIYGISTRVPNLAGCNLTKYSEIEITLPNGSDASTINSAFLNGEVGMFLHGSGTSVTFVSQVPARFNAPVNILLNGVTNPPSAGSMVLTILARNVLNGGIGTTASQPYTIGAATTPTPAGSTPTETSTFTPGVPTATPTPGVAACGGVLSPPSNCCNGMVDPGEECDDGGACSGGSSSGNACTVNAQCPGGECRAYGGDGCAANCTNERSVRFQFTGARCFGGFKDGQSCAGMRLCVGGAFSNKPCSTNVDCGPANDRGVCLSECDTAGDGSQCAGVGTCTAGDAGKIGLLCPSRLSGNLASSTLKTCQGGSEPGTLCVADTDCGGGGVCQNPCSPGAASGICRHQSGIVIESIGLVPEIPVGPMSGGLHLHIGKHDADGIVPVAVPANSVSFAPIRVPGLACTCIGGVSVPELHGPGNAASGIIGCGLGGLANTNVDLSVDHNTTSGDPMNGPGGCSGGTRDGLACGLDSDCGSGGTCSARGGGGGLCVGGANNQHLCHADADCPGSICSSPDDVSCSAAAPALPAGSGIPACLEKKEVCFGGTNPGAACSANSQCGSGGTCGTACNPVSAHPNVCNGPERLTFSGGASVPGSAILLTTLSSHIIGPPDDDGTCRKSSVCVPLTLNQPAAPVACAIDGECSSGQACRTAYCAGVCSGGSSAGAPCIRDTQCGVGGGCTPGSTFGQACSGLSGECDGGVCVPVAAAKGFDGLPCTADDVNTTPSVAITTPMTTGTASAGISDASGFNLSTGGLIFGGVCSGRSQCLTSVQGQAFDCSSLAGPAPSATGASFVSAYPQLDQVTIGDAVYTRKLTAK
ncbi:MAG: hypothetical protein HY270_22500 [Deltaproteobacteria bacterium]|nr:hypothetical protein [Deltaproteobacteria bacterium]